MIAFRNDDIGGKTCIATSDGESVSFNDTFVKVDSLTFTGETRFKGWTNTPMHKSGWRKWIQSVGWWMICR